MYIPVDGNTNDLFTQAPSPNSRRHYEFWTSLFNSTGYQIDINANNAEVAASGWTNPFNSLKAPIVPAHGYSVKVKDHHNNQDTVIVRLPKRDNIYYYFGSYGEQTSLH